MICYFSMKITFPEDGHIPENVYFFNILRYDPRVSSTFVLLFVCKFGNKLFNREAYSVPIEGGHIQ